MSPCCVAARDFDINSSVTDSENSSMHECVRFESLRLLATFARNPLWRSSDSVGGLGVARRLQKLFHDLSRLSTDHGVLMICGAYVGSCGCIDLRRWNSTSGKLLIV